MQGVVHNSGRVAGTLYLIPTPLGNIAPAEVLPEATLRIAASLSTFIVERNKTARAFLKRLPTRTPLQRIELFELGERTRPSELERLLAPLLEGRDAGLLSEAGCPAVADPGASLVRLAHARGLCVRPLVGPSAILLALMACGLQGQRFAFHGYLPVEADARRRALRMLEHRAQSEDAAQIFIETPYRSAALLEAILSSCRGDTELALACDLTLPSESIRAHKIAAWRESPRPPLARRPCVFLLWREPR